MHKLFPVNFFPPICQHLFVKYFRKQISDCFRLLEFSCVTPNKIMVFQEKSIVGLDPSKPLSFVGEPHRTESKFMSNKLSQTKPNISVTRLFMKIFTKTNRFTSLVTKSLKKKILGHIFGFFLVFGTISHPK
jgi:predicted lysophospholipase L1 biosynthesis ABC-type transport system permease subunit